jgi:hypothetical protein
MEIEMKTWKVALLCWLGFVAGMLCGCDRPFLPASFAADLDLRIGELQTDIADADADCRPLLQSDLYFLTSLKEASR